MRTWILGSAMMLGACALLTAPAAWGQGAPKPAAPAAKPAPKLTPKPAPGPAPEAAPPAPAAAPAAPAAAQPEAQPPAAEPAPLPPVQPAPPPPDMAGPQPPMMHPHPAPQVMWPAYNPGPAPEEPPAAPSKPWTTRDLSRDFWQVGLGVRVSWVSESAFDPFAKDNSLTHGSVFATRTLLVLSDLSFGAGLQFESGGSTATARGAPSSLAVIRPGAVLEGRYHLVRDVYVGIRLVPQAMRTSLRVEDTSAPADLEQVNWRFGLDSTAHVGWNVLRSFGVRPIVPEYWLLGDVGYGWAPKKDVALKPDLGDEDPRSRSTLNLGELSMRGVMMRVSVAMTF